MLFTLADIEFADFVGRWMKLTDRYADACNIFFGLKYGPPAYLDMAFLGIVQSLHLYHAQRDDGLRQRAEEESRLKRIVAALAPADARWVIDHVGARPYPSFERMLHELVSEHSTLINPLIRNRHDRFVSEVMNALQYVIHRDSEVGLAASHGAKLYWLMEKLRFLIKACFLSELNFSEQKTLALFERDALYQRLLQLEQAHESKTENFISAVGEQQLPLP